MERMIRMEEIGRRGRLAVVKSWNRRVDEFGEMYGRVRIWYDVVEVDEYGLGNAVECFKTLREAVRYVDEFVAVA